MDEMVLASTLPFAAAAQTGQISLTGQRQRSNG
jgi:hypothetical protein